MITRTCLLATCMTVVPLLAMFSHKVPRSVRESIRDSIRSILGHELTVPVPGPSTTVDRPEDDVTTLADSGENSVGSVSSPTVRHAATTIPADLVQDEAGEDERRLLALGAEGIECRRTPSPSVSLSGGSAGDVQHHVASCRLPVDPKGQLHRLFHAQGGTPAAALSRLRMDVEVWKSRVAVAPGIPAR